MISSDNNNVGYSSDELSNVFNDITRLSAPTVLDESKETETDLIVMNRLDPYARDMRKSVA